MTSLVVALLAERSEEELREMQSKLAAEHARVALELEQVTEALTRRARRSGARSAQRGGRVSGRLGSTQRQILDAVDRLGGRVTPADIISEMAAHGSTPSRGSIHTTIGRLVSNGLLVKPDDEKPYYELASRNGSKPETSTGPTENGEGQSVVSTDPNQSRA